MFLFLGMIDMNSEINTPMTGSQQRIPSQKNVDVPTGLYCGGHWLLRA